MAGELIWSRAALDDIEAIAGLISRDSPTLARATVERIFACAETLLARGHLHQFLLDLDDSPVLQQSLDGFRILYEQQGQDLHLLAVVHDRQCAGAG